MQIVRKDLGFYLRYSFFQMRERFTDFGSSIAFLLLYPYFIWLLTQMWDRFNSQQGNYNRQEIFVYISITEMLFLTFLRSNFIQRSGADFSLILARPRSWIFLTFFGQFGSSLCGRLIYILTALVVLPILGVDRDIFVPAIYRIIILLPILGIIEALMASVLSSAQILWHETKYLVLPITKIFLTLGGVFGPLADYGEPAKSIFLHLPASDLFFQVGHFCVRGEFYQMSIIEWIIRISVWITVFAIWNVLFFNFARKRHQSFGG